MAKLKLLTTSDELNGLFEKANGRGVNATVNREALFHALVDRSRLLDKFNGKEVEEAE
jgi:hypothetical protein